MTGRLVGKRVASLILGVALCCSLTLVFVGCSSGTYQPQEKSPSVSTPVIGKEGVLRVGVDANSSPFAGTTTSSGIVGINVDVAAAIADDLGLKLEIVDYGTDPAKVLTEGTVDIVMGIDETNSHYDFWTSDPYIESGVALFSKDTHAVMPTESNVKIAAQTSSMSAWEVNKQFGETALVSSESLQAAFVDLQSGTVVYVAADAVIGSFAANQEGIEAGIIGLLQKPSGYTIGVLDANTDLKQIMSDVLVRFAENGKISLIEKKWLGAPVDLINIALSESAQTTVTNDTAAKKDNEEDATS